MSNFEFPHTRTYDSDVGWLIKTVKDIGDEYAALVAWQTQHETDYIDLLHRVDALDSALDTTIAAINAEFEALKTGLEEEINTQISIALAQLSIDLGEIRAQITSLRDDLTRATLELNGLITANRDYLMEYIEERLQAFINSIPDLTTVNVLNPVRGYITSIQIAINDLYDLGRSEALTALEYDTLGLTASEYDSLQLTAYDYDNFGRSLIESSGYYRNPNHYMTSPFTGEYVRLEVVINELASLHKTDALTAAEYDALDITATYYDGLDLTAYDYDWNGKTLVV